MARREDESEPEGGGPDDSSEEYDSHSAGSLPCVGQVPARLQLDSPIAMDSETMGAMDTWLTILTSGVVAAFVSWLLNLVRDKRTADEARLEKHRDRVRAAVADFLSIDHIRHVLEVELTKAWDDVQRANDEINNRPDYNRGNPAPAYKAFAERTIEEKRPLLNARVVETDQAAARVDLLDDVLGVLAREAVDARPSPAYASSGQPGADKHAAALKALRVATRKVLSIPQSVAH